MKRMFLMLLVLVVLCPICLYALETNKHSYKPEAGYIPDGITAIKIAKAVLAPIYGEEKINKEDPFKTELKDGVWFVMGTLYCPDGSSSSHCKGGVAEVEILKDDGKILRVSHGK